MADVRTEQRSELINDNFGMLVSGIPRVSREAFSVARVPDRS